MCYYFADTPANFEFEESIRLYEISRDALTFFTGSEGLAIILFKTIV